MILHGRALHEVGTWPGDSASQTPIHRQLGTTNRVNHYPCAVGAIPNFQLEFELERHIPKGRTFHANVAPLLVFQPRHVVGGANVNVFVVQVRVFKLAGNSVGLGNLFTFQTAAFQHVVEVSITTKVELIGAV